MTMKSYGLVKHLVHVCLHLRLLQHQMDTAIATITSTRAATEPPIISSVSIDSSVGVVRARSVESVVLEGTMSEVTAIVVVVVVIVTVGGFVGEGVGCGGSVGV